MHVLHLQALEMGPGSAWWSLMMSCLLERLVRTWLKVLPQPPDGPGSSVLPCALLAYGKSAHTERMPADNFQFVPFSDTMREVRSAPESEQHAFFALRALMEVPEQVCPPSCSLGAQIVGEVGHCSTMQGRAHAHLLCACSLRSAKLCFAWAQAHCAAVGRPLGHAVGVWLLCPASEVAVLSQYRTLVARGMLSSRPPPAALQIPPPHPPPAELIHAQAPLHTGAMNGAAGELFSLLQP